MRRGVEEHGDMVGRQPVVAELLAQPRRMRRDGLQHHVEVVYAAGEGARDRAALPRRRDGLQVDARLAAQFVDDPLAHDGQRLPGELGIEGGDVCRGPAAESRELRLRSPADTPNVGEIDEREPFPARLVAGEVADPAQLRRGLGDLVGQLRQRLRRPDADAGGNARPRRHRRAQVAPELLAVLRRHGRHVEEALVDAVDLDVRRESFVHRVHPAAHVPVKRVVAAEDAHALSLYQVADQEHRRAHLDAERLRLRGPGDRAAVVVRQDDDGLSLELWIKDPLAGAVEAVAVDERERLGHRLRRRTVLVTTPKISMSASGPGSYAG